MQRLGLQTPAELSKPQFCDLAIECHAAGGVELVDTAGFVEPHADETPHLNLLVVSGVAGRCQMALCTKLLSSAPNAWFFKGKQ